MNINLTGTVFRGFEQISALTTGKPPTDMLAPTEYLQFMDTQPPVGDYANYMAKASIQCNPVTLAAVTVYRMGAAAVKQDWVVLEEGQSPCFAAGTLVHTREGLKPIEEIRVGDWVLSYPDDMARPRRLREESEYTYKQVTQVFVTEDKPLSRLIVSNLASGDREEFLVTPEHPIYCQGRGWVPVSKIDACDCVEQFQFANLMVSRCYQNVARGRVYNFEVEDFHTYYVGKEGVWVHNTCGPQIKNLEEGQPPCFAAGTLVHTREGLKPIEEIKVDDWVLSYPDDQTTPDKFREESEYFYKRVTQVFVTDDKPLCRLIVANLASGDREEFLVTPEHPIYCKGRGWVPVSEMRGAGDVLENFQFRNLIVFRCYQNVARGRVYNFEVEDFHTYYVGKEGVWVHNTCGPQIKNLEEGQPPCFAAGTLVHTREGLKPIEEIKVDDWVLSYPDDQTTPDKFREESEYFYKRVTQVFVTDDKPLCRLIVDNLATGDREEYLVTPEHPIYCKGRGWVPVSKIDACDAVENFEFRNLMVSRCYQNVARGRVYNFEVEDFHTYYVGKEGVWVHNTCGAETSKFELSKLDTLKQTDRVEIYKDPNWRNSAAKDTAENTGRIGEAAGNNALYKATGEDFRTDMRNKSNNGPDEWFFDRDRRTLYVGDEKASTRSNYKGVESLKLNAKVEKWIYEGSGQAFPDGIGRLNGQELPPHVQAEFRAAYDMWNEGHLEIQTFIMEVKVPEAGTSGELTVTIRPNPEKFVRVGVSAVPAGVQVLTRQDIGIVLAQARQYWMDCGASVFALNAISVDIAALDPGIAGVAQGNQVILSADGAGWGWYVDPTPMQAEEFLPGDTAQDFEAPDGSAAAGKLDLLTVLIHEMGHALGLGHSSQADDVMDAVLTPGERRLPGADDAAGLRAAGQYVATDKVFITRAAAARRTAAPAARPSFQLTANPELTNGDFGGTSAATSNTSGWLTTGQVTASHGDAVLAETAASQTQLSQFFHLGANARFLTFTIVNTGLATNASGPQDAFEVALLNASTHLSALADGAHTGTVDLTQSDALLNLQSDGTLRLADGVHRVVNADGSSTYTLALPAGLAGQDLVLSFDLLGFGFGADATGSSVSLRNVHIGQALAAADDSGPNGVEDTPLSLDLLANDQVGNPTTTTVQLLQAPQHGQATVDANGVLTYTPAANYFGADSLTYQLVDSATGQVSNVATVSVQVAPVNDAPQAHADAHGISEDAAVLEVAANEGVLQGQGADATGRDSDADNDLLTVVGVTAGDRTGPSSSSPSMAGVGVEVQGIYGSLWLQADGAYRYVPNAMAQTLAAGTTGLDVFTYTVADGQGGLAVATLTLSVAGANDAPVAASNVTGSLAEDGALMLNPLAGATDVDGDPLTAAVVTAPAHGSLLVHADGRISYVPDPDFSGSDSFTYRVSDGFSASGLVTVMLTIAAVNDAPVAQELAFSMTGNGAAVVPLAGTDVDNAAADLGYVIATAPQHGSVTRQADGRWIYTPATGYVGSDSFTYRATDGQLSSNVATVQITVSAPPANTVTIDLGVAGLFNVFALHDFTSTGSDTEGAIAAGNNLTLANYSVNANARAYHGLSAVVGGNFSFYGGSLHGTATYGGSQQSGQLSSGDVVRQAAPDFSFASEAARLTALSDQLATLPATGTVTSQWGGLFFSGDGKSAVQVFTISGADLMSANWSSFSNLSAGQTVIVNVTGSTAGFTGGVPNGFSAYNTLFNFSEALSLNFNNVGVPGTILAPRAQVNGGGGQINGNVIVKDWNSGIQINANHFFQPASVALGSGATASASALQTPVSTAPASPQAQSPAAALVVTGLPAGSVLEDGSHRLVITDVARVANVTGWNIEQLRVVLPGAQQGATAQPQVMAIHGDAQAGGGLDANPFIRIMQGDSTTPATAVGLIGGEAGVLGRAQADGTAAQRFTIRVLESSTSQYSFEVPLPGELTAPGIRKAEDEEWLRDLEQAAGKLWKEIMRSPS